MRTRVEVTGLDEIRQLLGAGGETSARAAKVVLDRKADQVLSMARPLVPVEPGGSGGQLRDSLRKGRATYSKKTGTISASVIVGGKPLEAATAGEHHRWGTVYAVLQEYDVGKQAPFRHTTGEAHFIERPVEAIAPTIPPEVLETLRSVDLGGL